MKVATRMWLRVMVAATPVLILGCSDATTAPPAEAFGHPMISPSFSEGGGGAMVTFRPGNSADPGATAQSSIPVLAAATQGVMFKLNVRGDVFTNLREWDSRTLASIDDGSFAGRKVELVAERNDRGQVHLYANWTNRVMVQTEYFALATIDAAASYVIYAHYNDAAAPQREIALFDGSGTERTRATQLYGAGGLAAGGSGVLRLARGLSNWSANGTIDGFAVYVRSGAGGILTGDARWNAPSPSDPGIVSLTGFDEGSGNLAGNAVSSGPAMILQSPQWVSGGLWSGGLAASSGSPAFSGPAPSAGNAIANFAPGNSGAAGAVATASAPAIAGARQGVAFKLRVRGDVFTKLGPWDSRTILSISDGTYQGRKVELVIERDDRSQVHLRCRWVTQEVATEFTSLSGFDPSRYYVIYAHYDDGASPQRQLVLFDEAGSPVQQVEQHYWGGDLPSAAATGVIALASGLGNWSANGAIDGVAVYVLNASGLLSGAMRYSAPAANDVGIASLVTFDEGSGSIAHNAVLGAPDMTVPSTVWSAGGSWSAGAPIPAPSSSPSAPAPAPAPVPSPPATTSSGNGRANQPSGYQKIAEMRPPDRLPLQIGCATGGTDGCWWSFGDGMSIQTDATAPVGSRVVEMTFPTGQQPGTGYDMFGGWAQSPYPTQYREIYESGWFKIPSADFENNLVGAKLWGYWGVGSAGAGNNANSMYMILDGDFSGTTIRSSWNIWFANQNGISWRLDQNVNTSKLVRANTWHQYELVMKVNDLGARNGTLKVWIDGTLAMSHDTVEFRNSANPLGFFGRKWDPIWGGSGGTPKSRTDHLWVNNIYLSGIPM